MGLRRLVGLTCALMAVLTPSVVDASVEWFPGNANIGGTAGPYSICNYPNSGDRSEYPNFGWGTGQFAEAVDTSLTGHEVVAEWIQESAWDCRWYPNVSDVNSLTWATTGGGTEISSDSATHVPVGHELALAKLDIQELASYSAVTQVEWDLDGDGVFEQTDPGPFRVKSGRSGGSYANHRFTSISTSHSWNTPGEKPVGLRVTYANGSTESVTGLVRVAPDDVSAFIGYPSGSELVLTGQDITFSSLSTIRSGVASRHEWDLDGDGVFELDTGTQSTVTTSYSTPGVRTPSLRVTSQGGEVDTDDVTLEVRLAPPAGEVGVSINTAANYTTSKNVVLDVVWPPFATAMRVSNDGGFLASQTTTFELGEQVRWVLDDSIEGLYTKIVYVRFSGSGIDETRTYSDDIIFDNRTPEVVSSDAVVLGGSLIVTVDAVDEESGLASVDLQSGSTVLTEDYSSAVAFSLADLRRGTPRAGVQATAVDLSTLRIRVTDKAGNATGWLRLGESSAATTISDVTLTSVTPERILDTRNGVGAPVGRVGALDGSATALELQVTGRGGVPAGASAVALNVTVVDGEANDFGGYVTVYPCGARKPEASNLNFVSGQTVPNSVIAPLSSTGTVCLYVYGTAHLLADVSGYFTSGFTPLTPARLLDTRQTGSRVGTLDGTGSAVTLRVAGQGGVPATGATAVALNVTVVGGQANDFGGYVAVYPCDVAKPDVSNLNFVSGQTVPNSVIAPLLSSGDVCLYVYGTAHLLVDVSGYFTSGFSSVTPSRVLDTRSGVGAAPGRVGALDGTATALELQVTGRADVPVGASAVALNVTVVGGETNDFGGYVTVYPCGVTKPDASNLNFVSGQTVPNSVVAPLSGTGTVCLYVYGTADLLVDVSGHL